MDHMARRFDNPDELAKAFDDPARDAWQIPDRVIAELGLKPGAVVADIGAGTGYFSVRLAQIGRAPRGLRFRYRARHGRVPEETCCEGRFR